VPASAARITLLLVCAAAFALRSAAAEPKTPQFRPEFTAFPELKPGREMKKLVVQPDGTTEREVVENPGVVFPPLAPLPTLAPLMHRVRHEQARAGLDYLADLRERGWTSLPLGWQSIAMRVYPIAAELEPRPTNRVMWYEARVRLLKEIERPIRTRALQGSVPPQWLNEVRFYRLAAEIELLTLLDEFKQFEAPPGALQMTPPLPPGPVISPPEPRRAAPPLPAPPPRQNGQIQMAPPPGPFPVMYTAFPGLIWDTPRYGPGLNRERDDPDARVGQPPKDLPVLPTNAPRLNVLQQEAALEAIVGLDDTTFLGAYSGPPPDTEFETAAEAYRLAAELEPRLADRLPWYEARVRALKGSFVWSERRVLYGGFPAYRFHAARFEHLQTEVDLLRLRARLTNTGTRPGEALRREEINVGTRTKPDMPPAYTAFPGIRAPVPQVNEQWPKGERYYKWVGADKCPERPGRPVPRADAPTRLKLRYEQVSEGLEYIDRVQQQLFTGFKVTDAKYDVVVFADLYRAAVDLANEPAERTRWLEQHVRDCKLLEGWTDIRTRNVIVAPYDRAFIRVHRLKAEIELLKPQFVAEQSP
jgi:hypothetical protein